jgi:hypothetical protein
VTVNGENLNNCPYIVGDKMVMECHRGPDRNKAHKEKRKLEKEKKKVSLFTVDIIRILFHRTFFLEEGSKFCVEDKYTEYTEFDDNYRLVVKQLRD